MKSKIPVKVVVDILMVLGLLFLMTYERIGEATHEWLATGMILLFVLHHVLNRKWLGALRKGKYTPYRIVQTLLTLLLLVSMTGSAVCGIVLSKHVYAALPVHSGRSLARDIHMLCGYWNLTLMSLHLGLHWKQILGRVRRLAGIKGSSAARTWVARLWGAGMAAYGFHAFQARQMGDYLTARIRFAFFDFDEPLVLFLLDYAAILSLFVWLGHYAGMLLQKKRS